MTVSVQELKNRAIRYLTGQDDLATFRTWFAGSTANVDPDADNEVAALVNSVNILFVRRGLGEITPEEFDRNLKTIAAAQVTFSATVDDSPSNVTPVAGVSLTQNVTQRKMEPVPQSA